MTINIINEIPRVAKEGEVVALDIEMFGQQERKLHRPIGTFACMSIQFEGEDDVYQVYSVEQLPETFERLKSGLWVLHNALYDLRQLRRWENRYLYPTETLPIYDTMLVERVLWGGYYTDFGLNDLARRYLDMYMEKETREQFESATEMTEEMKQYAALDVTVTLAVRRAQLALNRDLSVYWNIDMPMIWVILDMQPVKVDYKRWQEMAVVFEEKGKSIEQEIGVNVMSPLQVKNYLEKNRIKVESTGAEILEEFEGNEVVDKILQARLYRTATSKYGAKWLETYVEADDLVYSDWKVTGAETGRMSASNPPLQGIPARKLPEYRELFIPQNDYIFAPDVAQQEPRITAYLSQDKNLLTAVRNNESVHVYVARMIFNDPTIEKGEDSRYKIGKAISLGLSYGLTAQGTAKKVNIPLAEAEKLLHTYFQRFPDVENYIIRQRTLAMKRGYVETVVGRRIWLNLYGYQWENNAINAPIQGSAVDFTKMWGITIWRTCKKEGIPFPVNMFEHDEIVMDVEKEHIERIKEINRMAINTAAEMFPGVPFSVDENIGENWACHR